MGKQVSIFLRFGLRNHQGILKNRQLNLLREAQLSTLLWKQILRDRWTILRDHFGFSKRLKKQ